MLNLLNKINEERVLFLKNKIETVYLLDNPEKNITKFATGTQLIYEDIIKEVFGVACINDLHMMIRYNKSFQDSICSSHGGISEGNITLNMIIRVASKIDLLRFKKQLIDQTNNSMEEPQEGDLPIQCPFDPTIQLQEGIFSWDDSEFSYNSVKPGA